MSALTSFEIPARRPESATRPSFGSRSPPALAARSAVKRAMDLAGSIGGLILLSPLLALVGLLVRLESRGPVLFRQPRMGLNGRVFTCLKFRTMVPDAEQRLRDLEARNESAGGVLFKIKDDPRITPLGRFLRRTSLDELPQLWNVLVGEMSLVGPRPLQLRDSERLAEPGSPSATPSGSRWSPGSPGPGRWRAGATWTATGWSTSTSTTSTNWSMATDLQILFKTIAVVLGGKGAC